MLNNVTDLNLLRPKCALTVSKSRWKKHVKTKIADEVRKEIKIRCKEMKKGMQNNQTNSRSMGSRER